VCGSDVVDLLLQGESALLGLKLKGGLTLGEGDSRRGEGGGGIGERVWGGEGRESTGRGVGGWVGRG